MRLPYPRSLLGLLLLGFALVATPLVVGLAASAVYTDRLAARAQAALSRATQVTQSSRRLPDLLRELERSARQAAILGEREVPAAYAALRRQLRTVAERLRTAPFDAAQQARLERMLTIEDAVHAALARPEGTAEAVERTSARFEEAHRIAEETIAQADVVIERERASLEMLVDRARTLVFWLLAAVVPLAVLVIGGAVFALARPLRRLDAGIRAIGTGRLADPIDVVGPGDVVALGRRLEWLRTQLLDIEQQKNRFMRHVAHELKTPLAAVRESTDLLARRYGEGLTPTQRELADILCRNALELQRLVEDLLQLGEAQFRRLQVTLETVDLDAIVADVTEVQALAARSKALHLAVRLDADACRLRADGDKVRVILDNLFSNAIKHSPQGGTIELTSCRHDDALVLCVHDQGPGIAHADRQKIFDPFYQGRTAGTGSLLRSSGVGLSIVREYAAAHGGEVEVADDDRGGARICVRLPSPRVAENAA